MICHPQQRKKRMRKLSVALAERLPPKIQQIQKELPAWLQKTGNKEAAGAHAKVGRTDQSEEV